jgi:hypothetical protein
MRDTLPNAFQIPDKHALPVEPGSARFLLYHGDQALERNFSCDKTQESSVASTRADVFRSRRPDSAGAARHPE